MDAAQLKQAVIAIEKNTMEYVGNEIEAMRLHGGDRLANELLMSVMALAAARSIGILHLWSGEPIDAVRKRFMECMDHDLKATVQKMFKQFGEQSPGGKA